jgi:hypothetical protein
MLSALIRFMTALRSLVSPAIFTIEIDGDDIHVRSGEPPPGLVREFAEAARDFEIRRGTIRGIRAAQGITLSFSSDIPAEAHQRFRNILALHRDRIRGPGA